MTALRAPLIVVSGPSGVGKTTLVDALLGRKSLPLRRAITATTRAPRPGEIADVSYHFWTRQRFQEALARNEMLERAQVHRADFYGTPRSEVDPYRSQGIGVILVIDVQGAGEIRLAFPNDHTSVFIAPPRFEDLRERLEGRHESEESIGRRLHTAPAELARQEEFDHVLVNGDLTEATDALEAIVRREFQRRGF
ncbi:MAG TPA: guanylate kinase [Urbifossiella sp.]|jgi:guanylate kinase|nr:guanylate kinase [Urbifossiella sp.]